MTSIATDEREEIRGGIGLALRTKIELWLVVVFMSLAFGAGITIGVIAQRADTPTIGVDQANTAPANFGIAPPLTDQQLQAGLPSGHPAIGSDSGGTGGGGSKQNGSTSGTG